MTAATSGIAAAARPAAAAADSPDRRRSSLETTWGAMPRAGGGARFRLWAPASAGVDLVRSRDGVRQPLREIGDGSGWFELETDLIGIDEGYNCCTDHGILVPDPAARAQMGVHIHGPSRLVDPTAYEWQVDDWRGRPWADAVIYELHTGTFTAEGTFDAIQRKLDHLDHLAHLGVTAIELMPVAQWAGRRGWGYDGVLLYAPHAVYGVPKRLKALVDAAHARGLMIFLDVVYNHFGPEGNDLGMYAPSFFHNDRNTPWGIAIAYGRDPVRRYFIENALYWLHEFRFDGLRLDAVDQIDDQSDEPILEEIARAVREHFGDRPVHLATEDDRNVAHLHRRDPAGRPILYTAEWNDDWHHAAHVVATSEAEGYYRDFAPQACTKLMRALTEGYVYQGEPSVHRDGATRGEPSAHLPPLAFINFLQNHDQIGNRGLSERLSVLAKPEATEALTTILLLSPQVPLLYMGDEWGETAPFNVFADFQGDLARAVREGRRNEFSKWPSFYEAHDRDEIPDPNSPATLERSRLRWPDPPDDGQAARLALYRTLLATRARLIAPRLAAMDAHNARGEKLAPRAFTVTWRLGDGARLLMLANLNDQALSLETPPDTGQCNTLLHATPPRAAALLEGGSLCPWSVVVFLLIGP